MSAEIATFLAALAALATAVIALYQARAARDSSVVAVYQNFANMQTAAQQAFFQKPELYDMFRSDAPTATLESDKLSDHQDARQRHAIAVQLLDYYESILLNIEVLKKPNREYWHRYVVRNLRDSSYLREALLRDASGSGDDLTLWGGHLHQAAKDAEQRRLQVSGQATP
ncbi:MAG: hypothetical protein ACRDJE_08940 [Dehalococcoidia bacterium]